MEVTMSDFTPIHFTHTQTLSLNAPVEVTFPLFGPIEEARWAAGWNPHILFSDSSLGDSAGTIFTSQHAEGDTIWAVARFDHTDRVIDYVRVTPGKMIALLHITCDAANADHSTAHITYTFTALTEAGNHLVEHLREMHPTSVRQWEQAINHYLLTGEPAPHH
jgi:hypothetical protein